MSSFLKWTQHPDTMHWHYAFWIDDHFGHHHYGVRFNDDKFFDPEKIDLITVDDKSKIPKNDIIDETKDQSRYDSVTKVFELEKQYGSMMKYAVFAKKVKNRDDEKHVIWHFLNDTDDINEAFYWAYAARENKDYDAVQIVQSINLKVEIV